MTALAELTQIGFEPVTEEVIKGEKCPGMLGHPTLPGQARCEKEDEVTEFRHDVGGGRAEDVCIRKNKGDVRTGDRPPRSTDRPMNKSQPRSSVAQFQRQVHFFCKNSGKNRDQAHDRMAVAQESPVLLGVSEF